MEEVRWQRGKARVNPTVAAFMRRGFDDVRAAELHADGHTVGSLKQVSDARLEELGISAAERVALRAGARAEIPFESLARVLWANRWTCCVCRKAGRAIIVHHIRPWAESRDHSEGNLAVLCLEHHARAHTRGDLEQNLTERRLLDAKARWEEAVRHLDPMAILDATRADGFTWWWFNHRRLFELAQRYEVDVRALPSFRALVQSGIVDSEGNIAPGREKLPHLYNTGEGIFLYRYISSVAEQVLRSASIFNISEDLDRGLLARVVREGDIVLVQGRHFFKQRVKLDRGPGQVTDVHRKTNGVRISFSIDRWEATSTSAWAMWLSGTHGAASIVRVVDVQQDKDALLIKCSALAIGFELEGLANRSYVGGLISPRRYADGFDPLGEDDDEDPDGYEQVGDDYDQDDRL